MSVSRVFVGTSQVRKLVAPALGIAAMLACMAAKPAAAQRDNSKGRDDGFAMQDDAAKDNGPADDQSSPTRIPKFPGIVVLFSGKQKQVSENWIFQGSKKPAAWKVEDGAMVTSADSLLSKQHFLDFQLHVEFKVPYMPDKHGQERGNSGVGLLATYEIQVLDSFWLQGAGFRRLWCSLQPGSPASKRVQASPTMANIRYHVSCRQMGEWRKGKERARYRFSEWNLRGEQSGHKGSDGHRKSRDGRSRANLPAVPQQHRAFPQCMGAATCAGGCNTHYEPR